MSERRLALYRRAVEALRWVRLVSAAAVIGVAALAVLGWLLASRQVAIAEGELSRRRAEWRSTRAAVVATRSNTGELGADASARAALTSSVIADLSRAARARGNQVLSMSPVLPAETPEEGVADPAGLDISMVGSFDSIYSFLGYVDSRPLPLTITTIDWRPPPEATGEGQLAVRLKLGLVIPEE